jgi:hypothetical protein
VSKSTVRFYHRQVSRVLRLVAAYIDDADYGDDLEVIGRIVSNYCHSQHREPYDKKFRKLFTEMSYDISDGATFRLALIRQSGILPEAVGNHLVRAPEYREVSTIIREAARELSY